MAGFTNEQIIERLERAFTPYRCVATLEDYDAQIKIRVCDGQKQRLREPLVR